MRYALILLLMGCGTTIQPGYVEASIQVARQVAELVKANTGKDIEDLPVACEHEWDDSRLLLLCEVELHDR